MSPAPFQDVAGKRVTPVGVERPRFPIEPIERVDTFPYGARGHPPVAAADGYLQIWRQLRLAEENPLERIPPALVRLVEPVGVDKERRGHARSGKDRRRRRQRVQVPVVERDRHGSLWYPAARSGIDEIVERDRRALAANVLHVLAELLGRRAQRVRIGTEPGHSMVGEDRRAVSSRGRGGRLQPDLGPPKGGPHVGLCSASAFTARTAMTTGNAGSRRSRSAGAISSADKP